MGSRGGRRLWPCVLVSLARSSGGGVGGAGRHCPVCGVSGWREGTCGAGDGTGRSHHWRGVDWARVGSVGGLSNGGSVGDGTNRRKGFGRAERAGLNGRPLGYCKVARACVCVCVCVTACYYNADIPLKVLRGKLKTTTGVYGVRSGLWAPPAADTYAGFGVQGRGKVRYWLNIANTYIATLFKDTHHCGNKNMRVTS